MLKEFRHLGLLRSFSAAAKFESYSEAAEKLAISQAAISQQMRQLEESLSTKLFYRNGRTMRLTPQGKELKDYVERAFSMLEEGLSKVRCEPEAGLLRVTTSLSFASIWLVPRLWKFHKRYPEIRVKLIVSCELENMKSGEIDIALRQGEAIDTSIYQELLFEDPVYPVCTPDYVKKHQLKSIEGLTNGTLIVDEKPDRLSWENYFQQHNLQFPENHSDFIEVSTFEMGINAVLDGQGACLTSHCLAQNYIKRGVLTKPFDKHIEPGLKYSLLYDQNSPKRKRIEVFTNWIKEEIEIAGLTNQ